MHLTNDKTGQSTREIQLNNEKIKRKERQRTKQDFEKVKQQVSVEAVANYLLEKQGKNYVFPSERTASIKVYMKSNSFYDFGRGVGGDVVRLWAHVKDCDSWTALNEIRETFGLSVPDRKNSRELIAQQQQARKRQLEAEEEAKRQWVRQVDELKAEVELLSGILSSGHCKPLSWLWCTCRNRLTSVSGRLDLRCGIN